MKIILDTKVIIAAFATHGLCHAVFELCIDKFKIYSSEEIKEEVIRNLEKKFQLSVKIIEEIVNYLEKNTIITEIENIPEGICRDPEDDFLLGLIDKIKADYLITGDKELLDLKEYNSAKIVSPRQFWEVIKNTAKS